MPEPSAPSSPREPASPRGARTDTDPRRRRMLAVRSGHIAMAVMVAAAALGTALVEGRDLPSIHLMALGMTSALYIVWNLIGTRGTVRMLLWEGEKPLPLETRKPWGGAFVYFVVQLTLAGTVYALADHGRVPNLVWLALLPPVAYSVFLLERRGITVVTCVSLVLFSASTVRWHGWSGLPRGLLAFCFALLFTLVFTLLAVSAEKSRSQAEQLAAELQAANLKLREYAIQAEELAATRERNRLAREIHDSLGHYLTVVHVQLQAAKALHETDPARSLAALDKAQTLTREGLREIRDSVATLRSSPLDDRLLPEALQDLLEEHRNSGLVCRLTTSGQPRQLPPAAALTLYRAGQEALTNVRKHARAQHADIFLDFEDPRKVTLRVLDDGVGAPATGGSPSGFGLLGLRERTQLLGGRITAANAPGAGFALEVEVPG